MTNCTEDTNTDYGFKAVSKGIQKEQGLTIASIILLLLCFLVTCTVRMKRRDMEQVRREQLRRASQEMGRLEKRKKLIEAQLVVREWTAGSSSASPSNASKDKSEKDTNLDTTETASNEEQDDNESLDYEKNCPICFYPYKQHDLVCESNNFDCKHVFHKECMVLWLQKHEECPMCRNTYLLESV